jgi:adenosylcobinamide amidohydrolase
VQVEIGREAVVVTSVEPLRVLSSAVHHGGFAEARAIVNLHVHKDDPCRDPVSMIETWARRAAVPAPWVGLMTSARTEHAVQAEEAGGAFHALAVVTAREAARRSSPPPPRDRSRPAPRRPCGDPRTKRAGRPAR